MTDNNFKILFAAIVLILLLAFGGSEKPQNVLAPRAEKSKTQSSEDFSTNTNLPAGQAGLPKKFALADSLGFLGLKQEQNLPVRKDWTLLEPVLNVKSSVAKDLDSNVDMLRFNTGERWALASLTKLMSAVVVSEELSLNSSIVITDRAMSTEGMSGNFILNEVYSSGDLIKAMLVVSSNRAAIALADSIGTLKFVDKMQMKANALGMENTAFAEPTGLSFMNQGTVEDLEKLVGYIYENHPELLEISRQKSVALTELVGGRKNEMLNINAFAHSRPDFFGGKTGFTDQAGGNLITVFEHDGRKLLYIVLGTDDRFGQTELLSDWTFNAFTFK